ncbi:FAD-dependent monooxygenase [Granulicella cerasi]|uniref:FAD-dependent monooxygenase n=1 Tax=Granulicella cerasi TaxID=741063 RepID=A0ABW1ZB74_9BACT|nr:FAD-dependent monooxygenase [Granulicella cerasi]
MTQRTEQAATDPLSSARVLTDFEDAVVPAPPRTDVRIVGAEAVGVLLALKLSRAGKRVVLYRFSSEGNIFRDDEAASESSLQMPAQRGALATGANSTARESIQRRKAC